MIAGVCRLAPYSAQQVVTRFDNDGCVLSLEDLGSVEDLGCTDFTSDPVVKRENMIDLKYGEAFDDPQPFILTVTLGCSGS
jgi:hypothetical protein